MTDKRNCEQNDVLGVAFSSQLCGSTVATIIDYLVYLQ